MCHCGNNFCGMSDEAFAWANAEYGRLFQEPEWQTRYPNGIERQFTLEAKIYQDVVGKFGPEAAGPAIIHPTITK